MKRDIITEISEYRGRLRPRSARWLQVADRLRALDAVATTLQNTPALDDMVRSEAAKYLPIGYVACIEAMTRMVIRDLIDRTEVGKKNLAVLKDLRFGVEHIAEIHSGTLTLGEFVSHLLSCNNLDDIERYISALAGDSLLKRVRAYNLANDGQPTLSLDERGLSGVIFDGVKRTFELRHIFCHEVAPEFKVDFEEIRLASACSALFIALESLAITELCGE